MAPGPTGKPAMHIFGLTGRRGSGKTTLMVKLVPELTGRGFSVSAVAHAHPPFEIDRPGKDSYRHRVAGAAEVMVASAKRWALIHAHHGATGPSIDDLMAHLTPVDLLIAEGFTRESHPKIEVHRPAQGQPPLCANQPHIVAVASDAPIDGLDVPVLDLGDVAGIGDFIVDYCGLETD